MSTMLRSLLLIATALMLQAGRVWAQEEYSYTSAPDPYYSQLFSEEELDNLVAPIALYPDPLLAQLFVAATFSDQLDIAARHVRVFGTGMIDNQPWDVSVRSIAHYPPVLNMLVERPDWAAAIGQAYTVQGRDMMDAVQRLRRMAHYQGNLVNTAEHSVIVEPQIIRIVPAHPRVIYVPVYNPDYMYHRRGFFHASVRAGNWSFGVGFPIGSWLSYDCDWRYRRVYYDGWRGGGWRVRSRPFIQIVNVYVHPRYEVININRTIVHHTVNYVNLRKNNTVHRNVDFGGYSRNITRVAAEERDFERRVAKPRSAERIVSTASPSGNIAGVRPVMSPATEAEKARSRSGRVQPPVSAPARTENSQTAAVPRQSEPSRTTVARPRVMERAGAVAERPQTAAQRPSPSGRVTGSQVYGTAQRSAPPRAEPMRTASPPAQQNRQAQSMPQQNRPPKATPQQSRPSQAMPQQSRPSQAMPQQSRPSQAMPQQSRPSQVAPRPAPENRGQARVATRAPQTSAPQVSRQAAQPQSKGNSSAAQARKPSPSGRAKAKGGE